MHKIILENGREILYDEINHIFEKLSSSELFNILKKYKCKNKNNSYTVKLFLGRKCNFNCLYCSQNESKKSFLGEQQCKNKQKLVDKINELCNNNIRSIEFWGGEPLLYINEIKEYTKLFENIEQFQIITNGSLLKGDCFDFIKNNKKFRLTLSYDGKGQSFRGLDILEDEEIYNNVKYLINENRLYISTVCTEKTGSLIEFINFMKTKFDSFIINDFRYNIIINDDNSEEYLINDIKKYSENFYNDLFILDEKYKEITFNFFNLQINEFISEWIYKEQIKTKCVAALENIICIDQLGNIVSCHNFNYNDVDQYGNKHFICNIFDIMPNTKNLKLYYLDEYQEKLNKKCNGCLIRRICKGGCIFTDKKYDKLNCEYEYYKSLPIFKFCIYKLFNSKVESIEKC